MTQKTETEGGALTAAAEALEQEIARFEAITEAARRHPLDSQKHIEQSARAARDAAESEARFAEKVRALVDAVTLARDRQQRSAELINTRIGEVNARAEAFHALQQEFAALGNDARQINDGVKIASDAAAEPAQKYAVIQDIGAQLGKLAERAAALADKARDTGFVDLTHDADALRQQMLAARNKLKMVEESLKPL